MFKKHNLGLLIKRIGIFKTKLYIFVKIIKGKTKMKKKILKGILSTILRITAIGVALGFILPISTITPYWIILSC